MKPKNIVKSSLQAGVYIMIMIFLHSCGLSDSEIKRDWWLYGSGYHIGDQLRNLEGKIKNDTIYQSGKPAAVIYSTKRGFLGSDNEIVIKALDSDKLGYYHYKGE